MGIFFLYLRVRAIPVGQSQGVSQLMAEDTDAGQSFYSRAAFLFYHLQLVAYQVRVQLNTYARNISVFIIKVLLVRPEEVWLFGHGRLCLAGVEKTNQGNSSIVPFVGRRL